MNHQVETDERGGVTEIERRMEKNTSGQPSTVRGKVSRSDDDSDEGAEEDPKEKVEHSER